MINGGQALSLSGLSAQQLGAILQAYGVFGGASAAVASQGGDAANATGRSAGAELPSTNIIVVSSASGGSSTGGGATFVTPSNQL